jgi:hypothetical protein
MSVRGAGVAQAVYWLQSGQPEFDSRQRQRIFPLASVSRSAPRPTQPPVQWVPGVPQFKIWLYIRVEGTLFPKVKEKALSWSLPLSMSLLRSCSWSQNTRPFVLQVVLAFELSSSSSSQSAYTGSHCLRLVLLPQLHASLNFQDSVTGESLINSLVILKLSHYTPWRRLVGEEV